jgi:hypothetical protein
MVNTDIGKEGYLSLFSKIRHSLRIGPETDI